MRIKVKLFSIAKDLAGFDEQEMEVPASQQAGWVLDSLAERYPRFLDWKPSVRIAVNCEYVDEDHALKDGDEVAVIPPVSGG